MQRAKMFFAALLLSLLSATPATSQEITVGQKGLYSLKVDYFWTLRVENPGSDSTLTRGDSCTVDTAEIEVVAVNGKLDVALVRFNRLSASKIPFHKKCTTSVMVVLTTKEVLQRIHDFEIHQWAKGQQKPPQS